ncbi:MAG: serine/threonine protein kinase [Candidatus Eremiobacteraeota bacterium]|nr:serine/threonine protein kinase [Candidatus Eremiobacteraeota bacterium]
MNDFQPEVLSKLLVFLGGLVLFIRTFARSAPPEHINPRAPLPADRRLDGLLLGEPLADGGTATVYQALEGGGELVAVKIPHREQLKDKEFIASFSREAEIGMTLRHPSIVKVLAVGDYQTDEFPKIPYFSMEFLEGNDLRTLLKQRGTLPPLEAAQIARSAADALGWAHHRGVIHRDVSPRNIFITNNRRVKVMDFGVSTVFCRSDRRFLNKAMRLGTPEYLAPERTAGSENDPRSDLYSLGCVFYEMLSGAPPFAGESPKAILMMHRKAAPVSLSHDMAVDPRLEAIVMKLLAKDPEQRYQSAAEVTAAIADLIPAV